MMRSSQPPLVVIVGGGISGLTAAYYLLRSAREADHPLRVQVIERDRRLGGKIRTDTFHSGDEQQPFIVEGGPDAFLAQKPWAESLARELGMGDQLIPINSLQPATSVLVHGKAVPLPAGLRLITPTKYLPFLSSPVISPWGKARMLVDLLQPARRVQGDESLGEFVRARLGDEALDRLAEPLMAGIHSGDPEKQSILATFPQMREVERRYGSIIRGTRKLLAQSSSAGAAGHPPPAGSPFLTLRAGMGSLTEALAAELEDHVWSGRRVLAILPSSAPATGYQVQLDDGATLDAHSVIISTPSYVAADLVESWQPELAAKLRRISYVSTGTLSLAYPKQAIRRPFAGFGLVIPRAERRLLNAITISSEKFAHRAPAGHVLLRVFFGGFRSAQLVDESDADLLELVARELHQLMGISVAPRFARIYRWREASPQYHVGHLDLVREINALASSVSSSGPGPQLVLCGAAYEGVGIPDCVRLARNAAEQVFRRLQGEPDPVAPERPLPV
jgi:protoporphyrinogen/coproporphyrinogen III oxidase